MPIVIKNYKWQQTEFYITIKIPLKNVHKKDVDLFAARCYVKASYHPYFFELFLFKPIDISKSNCYIKDEEIIFELCKLVTEQWGELEAPIHKSDKIALKKMYLDEVQKHAKELDDEKITKKCELKRQAVREQISIDTKFRSTMSNIKKEETEKALRELQLSECIENKPVTQKQIEATKRNSLPAPNNPPSKYDKKRLSDKVMPSRQSVNKEIPPVIPLPRKSQTVNISFTERAFPTPSRESKAEEENEWLTKQAEARRTSGFIDEDLRPEERNPQWLQDKGDEFFKAQNYLAAVSAYTTGIKISKNLVSLYVSRSAAQFELGNLHKCIDDCSNALDLMTPVCEANRKMRSECIARRGTSLFKLKLFHEGIGEIEAAIKLAPNDESFKQELKNMKEQMSTKNIDKDE